MSCKNQSGAGLKELKKGIKKLFKGKPTPTKFAKAVRELDHKKILELIKEGADVNAKFRGKSPLEIVLNVGIAMHNRDKAINTIITLIHNGCVIDKSVYKQYKDKEEQIEYLLENGTHLDAMDFGDNNDQTNWDDEWESMAYDENDEDELEVMKVLTGAYEKALKKYKIAAKKAIKKGIKGKKGMELGIADIIGNMAIGAGKKRKPKKGGGKKNKKTAKQMREAAKKCKKSCKCKKCKCKKCKC